MKVNEIFLSVEGEGIRSGIPAVFIRLQGCNLKCSYCDTQYACIPGDCGIDYNEMSSKDILDKVLEYNIRRVTITGGEPLIHEGIYDLIDLLVDNEIEVNIETNGSIEIPSNFKSRYGDSVIITMDWKSMSSDMSGYMIDNNLNMLTSRDVLKFVVSDLTDLQQMHDVICNNNLSCNIFVSPVFEKIDPVEIVKFILSNQLYDIRIQLQIHKIIWPANMRGV